MLYKEWLKMWLTLYVQPTVKIRTYEKYEQICRIHITPALGEYELHTLSAVVLQNFVVKLANKLSANTVNSVITVLQKSLKMSAMAGVCSQHFADKIIRPKTTENKVECFSLSEQKRIEQYILCNPTTKLFGIVLCLYTGLRIGELLALTWDDVDFKKSAIIVNKSCHYGKNEKGEYTRFVDTPKTLQSKRLIPLPKQLIPYVKNLKKSSACKFVVSYKGKAVVTRSYQRSFELVLQKLKIPHKGFHSLRHTFATRALECGMDVKTLSELLGHKNATITLNRYVHSLLEHKVDMMNKLGKFCGL